MFRPWMTDLLVVSLHKYSEYTFDFWSATGKKRADRFKDDVIFKRFFLMDSKGIWEKGSRTCRSMNMSATTAER